MTQVSSHSEGGQYWTYYEYFSNISEEDAELNAEEYDEFAEVQIHHEDVMYELRTLVVLKI